MKILIGTLSLLMFMSPQVMAIEVSNFKVNCNEFVAKDHNVKESENSIVLSDTMLCGNDWIGFGVAYEMEASEVNHQLQRELSFEINPALLGKGYDGVEVKVTDDHVVFKVAGQAVDIQSTSTNQTRTYSIDAAIQLSKSAFSQKRGGLLNRVLGTVDIGATVEGEASIKVPKNANQSGWEVVPGVELRLEPHVSSRLFNPIFSAALRGDLELFDGELSFAMNRSNASQIEFLVDSDFSIFEDKSLKLDLTWLLFSNETLTLFETKSGVLYDYNRSLFADTFNKSFEEVTVQDTSVTVNEDRSVRLSVGVTPSNASGLTYSLFRGPSHGNLSGSAPNWRYSPNDNYHGSDRVVFTVKSGGISVGSGTIDITVLPVNDRPEIDIAKTSKSVVAGELFTLTPGKFDIDGDDLEFSISNKPHWANFNSNSGRIYGYPKVSDVDVYDNVRLTLSDGSLSDHVNIKITVLEPPPEPTVETPPPPPPAEDPIVETPPPPPPVEETVEEDLVAEVNPEELSVEVISAVLFTLLNP